MEKFEFALKQGEITIMGYRRPKDANASYKKYTAFKHDVMALAMEAGFRPILPDRNKSVEVRLSVFVAWAAHAKSDWSNIYKSVEDALFKHDRYVTPGPDCGAIWDQGGNDIVLVKVEVE